MNRLIALVAAGLFATGTVFAGQHGDCTKQVKNQMKPACQVSMANLDLTPAQKTKMDAIMAEHEKEGCSKATEAKYMREAKTVLTKAQYAKFKAECNCGQKSKAQA